MHHRPVVWDRVIHFEFVGPPIREGRSTGIDLNHCVCDLIAFEDVLEGGDVEVQASGQAGEHENLILAVGMDVHISVPFRISRVASSRRFFRGCATAKISPFPFIFRGCLETAFHELLHAHAGLRIAHGVVVAPVALLNIFPEISRQDERFSKACPQRPRPSGV